MTPAARSSSPPIGGGGLKFLGEKADTQGEARNGPFRRTPESPNIKARWLARLSGVFCEV